MLGKRSPSAAVAQTTPNGGLRAEAGQSGPSAPPSYSYANLVASTQLYALELFVYCFVILLHSVLEASLRARAAGARARVRTLDYGRVR